MKRYLVEVILGFALIIAFLGVWVWQSADRLSKSEVDGYVRILEKSLPVEWMERDEFISRMRL